MNAEINPYFAQRSNIWPSMCRPAAKPVYCDREEGFVPLTFYTTQLAFAAAALHRHHPVQSWCFQQPQNLPQQFHSRSA